MPSRWWEVPMRVILSVVVAVICTLKVHGVITVSWFWLSGVLWIPLGALAVLTAVAYLGCWYCDWRGI